MRIHQIVVCGNLCNTDIAVAELLSRYTLRVTILRYQNQKLENLDFINNKLKYFNIDDIIYVNNSKQALHYLKKSDLIISITGSVDNFLRFRDLFYRNYIILPKTINITTGGDITELIRLKTLEGKKFCDALNRSLFNFLNPYPQVIESLKIVKLQNYQIIKSPYYLLDPVIINGSIKSSSLNNDVIHYLHLSNLDWGITDNKPWRNTTKGNNRFLAAFIRAVKSGAKIHCAILLRGSDKDLARKIISDSGCEKAFEFLPEVKQGELSKIIMDADIIVDQFDVGALGGIACECMAQAKPVMIYIDKNCWPLVYDEEPPVINCHTEDEIYNAILEWADRKKLQELGERAEKWVRKYHDVHTANFSEFILMVCLAAGLEWPRKDLVNDYK